jgi:hypothetical protein
MFPSISITELQNLQESVASSAISKPPTPWRQVMEAFVHNVRVGGGETIPEFLWTRWTHDDACRVGTCHLRSWRPRPTLFEDPSGEALHGSCSSPSTERKVPG